MIRLFPIITMLLFMVPIRTDATTLTLAIPGTAGIYVDGAPERAIPFNLGVQFSSISSATLGITGTGTPGRMQVCDLNNPPNCFIDPIQPNLSYGFAVEQSGLPPFGLIGPFGNISQTLSGNLNGPPGTSLNFLLDGVGTLYLGHAGYVCEAIYTCTPLEPPSLVNVIDTVKLEITGNLIPEPGTFFLSALGIAAITTIRRKQGIKAG